jgi:hypothetical protein
MLMPRKPSVSLVGVQHVIQLGKNRQVFFAGDGDTKAYVTWLKEYVDKFYVAVHARVLMTNHVKGIRGKVLSFAKIQDLTPLFMTPLFMTPLFTRTDGYLTQQHVMVFSKQ